MPKYLVSDYLSPWRLGRDRFVASFEGLSESQLRFVADYYPNSIGQLAIHVAGSEVFMALNILQLEPRDDFERKVYHSVTDGMLNDKVFPFEAHEITRETIGQALRLGESLIEPLLQNPTPEHRKVRFGSPLGPEIDGDGAFARMTFHASYHQGQVYIIRNAPNFPK